MVRFALILSALATFCIVPYASAQITGGQDPVQFLIAPQAPAPGDTVSIEIQGVGTFLGNSTITWQVNGKTAKSGVGERTFVFTAGGIGSKTTVTATINSSTKGVISRSFSFTPSSVQLFWEADTTVPPWYKGKALYTSGANLSVIALPQVIVGGRALTYNNLSFNWKRNDTPLTSQSGRGANRISFAGNQLLPGEVVSVDVLAGTTVVAHSEIYIPASKPQVVIYERDPLRGTLYDRALSGSVSLIDPEFTAEAVPYFFSNSSIKAGSAPYAWRLNNQDVTGPETAVGVLTLRQSGSGAGRAVLEVSMQNIDPDKYLQSASTVLNILFGGATNSVFSSFFGI